jgi:hypothetical protein
MGVVVSVEEKDRPPAGTACVRCTGLGHFCQATEFLDDSEDALCDACLEAEDCPRIVATREPEQEWFEVAPVKSVKVDMLPPPEAPNIEGIVARLLAMDYGEGVKFRPSAGLTLFDFRTRIQREVETNYPAYRFSFENSADRRDLIVKRLRKEALKPMSAPVPVKPKAPPTSARSPEIAERGIRTARDFVDFMGALMADLVSDRIHPQTAQAACLAADKMLKVVEMQHKYAGSGDGPLQLVPEKEQKRLGEGK